MNCRRCTKRCYGEYCFQCKPRKPIKTHKLPAKVGKQGKLTAKAVTEWKKTQPSNHQGYWTCYLCGKWVEYLVGEHVKSKTRHPELRTEHSNLKPTCNDCNEKKGSEDGII